MPAPASVQAATLNKFIEVWKTTSPEAWTSLWSDDCTHRLLPFSLKAQPMSKADVLKSLPKLFAILKNWELDVHQIVHDAARSKAVIYATSAADTPFGDFKWTNEYAVFVYFTEDGEKISQIEEMVDSAFFQEFQKTVVENAEALK
ncbi:hypothetical protein N431DRAFT_473061 [Stipitochalara longipes BDJ]|nr:hypothetical protein N431DRAFT_473061 [Stipitochalara longipes BDJ]